MSVLPSQYELRNSSEEGRTGSPNLACLTSKMPDKDVPRPGLDAGLEVFAMGLSANCLVALGPGGLGVNDRRIRCCCVPWTRA